MEQQEATALFYAHVWPHRAMVVRTARFLTRHAADAEDLAQETLVKAYKSMSRFDLSVPGASVRGWLSSILRNTWIDKMRAQGRAGTVVSAEDMELEARESLENIGEIEDVEGAEEVLERFSDERIISALQGLPAEIRWTLLLVDVEGMEHTEAAEVLGVPVGTVKSRAFRGRRMLRERLLSDKGFEEACDE